MALHIGVSVPVKKVLKEDAIPLESPLSRLESQGEDQTRSP